MKHNPRIPSAVYVEDVLGTDEYPGEGHDECAMGENDMTTTDTSPAAQIIARAQALIEDIRARHVYGKWATSFDGREHWGCMICLDSYPCDAATLADKLEQAVTALGEANVMADEVKAYGDCEHNEFGRVFAAMHNYRDALRRSSDGRWR